MSPNTFLKPSWFFCAYTQDIGKPQLANDFFQYGLTVDDPLMVREKHYRFFPIDGGEVDDDPLPALRVCQVYSAQGDAARLT
jgi:hypothetical protein